MVYVTLKKYVDLLGKASDVQKHTELLEESPSGNLLDLAELR